MNVNLNALLLRLAPTYTEPPEGVQLHVRVNGQVGMRGSSGSSARHFRLLETCNADKLSAVSSQPRFFIPSRHGAAVAPRTEPLAQAVDAFVLEYSSAHAVDVVVGVDRRGALGFAAGPDIALQLTEGARAQLHVHELSRPTKRVIAAETLSLFALELCEHISNPSDLNDPVCLYGTLQTLASHGGPAPTRGQLTITRGDFLQGFLSARPWAFRYGSQHGGESLCNHALVPAGSLEDIQRGRDLVLVYPLPPVEVADDDMDNGGVVELLLGDTLQVLRADLEKREAARGTLAKWFGGSLAKALTFPAGATRDVLFLRAAEALRMLDGWPNARSTELFTHVRTHGPMSTAPITRAPGQRTAQTPVRKPAAPPTPPHVKLTPAQQVAALRTQNTHTSSGDPPAWMQDFLRDHRTQGAHVKYSALPTPARTAPAAPSRASEPEWMSDFTCEPAPASTPADPTKRAEKPAQSDRPAWMDDFDDE